MIKRIRRVVALTLVPFVLFWSIMLPRQAYAFAPVGAAPIVIVGTIAGGAVVPIVMGAAIAGIAYWAFKDIASLEEVRVPAVESAAGVVPAPAAPATATSTSTGGGSSSAATSVQEYAINVWSSSKAAACAAFVGAQPSSGTGGCGHGSVKNYSYGLVSSDPSCHFTTTLTYEGAVCGSAPTVVGYSERSVLGCPSGYTLNGSSCDPPPVVYSCPSGYSVSGSTCVLSNARAAVADGKQDFGRTGTAYAPISGDLPGGLSATTMTKDATNDTVVVAGKDSAGNAMQGSITALPGGGSKVELKTQKQAANGQTYVETQTFKTSSVGDVVEATQTATAGSLAYNPTTKTYTDTAAPAGTLAPDLGSSPQTTTQFPSDYARQGEAATAAQSISNTLGPKLDKLTEASAAPADLTLPDPSTYTDFGTTFNGLLGWQLPGHSSQCPSGSFNTPWNTSYTLDAHCQLVSNHWQALQAAMMVVWTIGALFIVLKA